MTNIYFKVQMSSTRDGQILALGPVSCDDDDDGVHHCNDGYLDLGTVPLYDYQHRNLRYKKGKISLYYSPKLILRILKKLYFLVTFNSLAKFISYV